MTERSMEWILKTLRAGPEVIKLFSSSTQLSMKFQLLKNVKIHVVKICGKFRFTTQKLVVYPAHKCYIYK